jgi:hypothetical protein
MEPITLGIAAIAALILQACGGDEPTNRGKKNENDSGTDATGMDGSDGSGGNTSTGGMAGSGGAAGSGGSGGVAGYDGGSDSAGAAGMGGSSYVDGSILDAGTPVSIPCNFGFRYGTTNVSRFSGTGALLFSEFDPCRLIGGTLEMTPVGGGQSTGFSVDLSGKQGMDFCGSQVELPFTGGLMDGVTWMLTNSGPNFWQISSCGQTVDSGVPLEKCEGALTLTP